jgi:homoserine O-acetyltransferase
MVSEQTTPSSDRRGCFLLKKERKRVVTSVDTVTKKTVAVGQVTLECGETLQDVHIAVETVGRLSVDRDNVVLVCHALTGDAHAVGDEREPGWWDGLIGPGRYIDTNRYFVITTNVLGGCNGSTGPSSINPDTGRPYGSAFPPVTIRDMVHVQYRTLREMGIDRVHTIIGGSMGGMQVLEWGILYPEAVANLIPIATTAALSPMAIAYNDIGRQAIMSDPDWQGGDYYPGPGPKKGLAIARMVGMVTYRTDTLFHQRFQRRLQTDVPEWSRDATFQVESYLRYQGEKLVNRFDANSYLCLLKAMDTHDVGRGRGGMAPALSKIRSRVLIIGIEEDRLFQIDEQRTLFRELRAQGKDAQLWEFRSPYGHDAFLIEYEQMGPVIQQFLEG